jgi:hypothetical protein
MRLRLTPALMPKTTDQSAPSVVSTVKPSPLTVAASKLQPLAAGVTLPNGTKLAGDVTGSALAAFVEFTDATAQHRQRVYLAYQVYTGTFDWTQVVATLPVPTGAKRMQFFFGLKPATGKIWLDDFSANTFNPVGIQMGPTRAN